MTTPMCGTYYDRVIDDQVQHVPCTYVAGHKARHSWETLKAQDDADRQETLLIENAKRMASLIPVTITSLTDAIDRGDYDPYLELVLAHAHNRKRALRNVPGFTPMRFEVN